MKQRVTYIVDDAAEGFDPANLSVEKQSITVSALAGAREQHITFGLHELPSEVTNWTLEEWDRIKLILCPDTESAYKFPRAIRAMEHHEAIRSQRAVRIACQSWIARLLFTSEGQGTVC